MMKIKGGDPGEPSRDFGIRSRQPQRAGLQHRVTYEAYRCAPATISLSLTHQRMSPTHRNCIGEGETLSSRHTGNRTARGDARPPESGERLRDRETVPFKTATKGSKITKAFLLQLFVAYVLLVANSRIRDRETVVPSCSRARWARSKMMKIKGRPWRAELGFRHTITPAAEGWPTTPCHL